MAGEWPCAHTWSGANSHHLAATHPSHISDCGTVASGIKYPQMWGRLTCRNWVQWLNYKQLVPTSLGDLTWAGSSIKVIISVFHRCLPYLIIQILKHLKLTFHLDSISGWHCNYFLLFSFIRVILKDKTLWSEQRLHFSFLVAMPFRA